MNNIKYIKSKIVHLMPKWLKVTLYKIWRLYWLLKIKIIPSKYYIDHYSKDETIYIVPDRIKYAVKNGFDIYKYKGRVIGGNWDINVIRFDKLDFFRTFRDKIGKKIGWEETSYYKRVLSQINKGEVKWACRNKEELDKRCSKLDEIWKGMKEHGYKKGWNENEVTINIGRNGEILFNNGRHRLTFAKLLKLEEIPVKVTVRHKQWVALKNEIFEYSKKFENKVYAPLIHPDLRHIPSHYDDTRFRIIKENMKVKGGTLLDIGSHWGYFCHKFEDEGFDCYCVEKSKINLYFLQKFRETEKKKFKIIPYSIFNLPDNIPKKYDIIIALSIFHHFIKEEHIYKKFIEFLKTLKGKELFFEPHNPEEPQMKGAYMNFDNDEFASFIIQNSSFTSFKRIGFSEHGRPIYRIS